MSVVDTITERATTHGDFRVNSRAMQALKSVCMDQPGWCNLSPYQRESIEMICHKLGRILCGNPDYLDHWHDIAGYATLVENILAASSKE